MKELISYISLSQTIMNYNYWNYDVINYDVINYDNNEDIYNHTQYDI